KLGEVETAYFFRKFGVNVTERFAAPLRRHQRDGLLGFADGRIVLTRAGLLRVDRLLHDFFLEEHRAS
ncbi:MAG: coproporphyrinogen III oxidase, partial [Myxococcota bacterium]